MENMEDLRISAVLERIGKIRSELHALEEQVKALPGSVAAPASPVDEVAGKAEKAGKETDVQTPIDLSIADIDIPAAPAEEPAGAAGEAIARPSDESVAEPVVEVAEVTVREDAVELENVAEDLPEEISVPDTGAPESPVKEPAVPVHEEAEAKKKAVSKAIMDSVKADHAVMDVMAEKQAWKIDRPGSAVKNIISAISLNDRVLLINVLFREDPILFQETIARFNDMGSLDEAVAYVAENFPDWDMNSEPVYRLMMAVRRKLS